MNKIQYMNRKQAIRYLKSHGFSIEQIKTIQHAFVGTGIWINDNDTIGVYYCSECGGYVASHDAYCKCCGAKMLEGGKE